MGFEPKRDEIKALLGQISVEEKAKDSENSNTIDFNEFLQIIQIKMNEKESSHEIAQAFKLFTEGGINNGEEEQMITFESLKHIAEMIGRKGLNQRKTFQTKRSER